VGSNRRVIAAIALVALLGAACGSSEDGGSSNTEAAAGGGGALTITAPEDGAELTIPFTIELDSADALGAPETGEHHVHIFYDGDDSEYEVVTSDSFQVTDLSPGHHSVTASLRNADHSAAGTDVTVHLLVLEEEGGGSDDNESEDKDSGGDMDDHESDDSNYGY
jgi:hypothetical protein